MSINRSFPFPFSLFSLLFSLRSSLSFFEVLLLFPFFLCVVVVFVVCVVIVVGWGGSSSPSSSSEGKVVPLLARPVERA